MKCHNCNSEMKQTNEAYHYMESGLDNVYLHDVDFYRCECGENFASIPAIIELNAVIALHLIKKKTFLTGQEVRFLRKNIGLSAKAFSEFIGMDNATVSRWENNKGTIDKSNDRMIRLFYANFKEIPSSEIKVFLNEIIKEIAGNNKEFKINIPIEALRSKHQFECTPCC